jgi:hypothetical protein
MNDARWQYDSVTQISIGDNIYYRDNWYQVLINYISGETDKTGYTPLLNRTILIDDDGNRVTCHNYKQLRYVKW